MEYGWSWSFQNQVISFFLFFFLKLLDSPLPAIILLSFLPLEGRDVYLEVPSDMPSADTERICIWATVTSVVLDVRPRSTNDNRKDNGCAAWLIQRGLGARSGDACVQRAEVWAGEHGKLCVWPAEELPAVSGVSLPDLSVTYPFPSVSTLHPTSLRHFHLLPWLLAQTQTLPASRLFPSVHAFPLLITLW